MADAILYDYWRSSAAYRVRIALSLKRVAYHTVAVNLAEEEHHRPDYLQRNPQGFVPALEIDGRFLTQSLAIVEYLDETRPSPALLPATAADRQRVRALCHAIAMDIHPVCNVSVARYGASLIGGDAAMMTWMHHFMRPRLVAFEAMLAGGETGRFCHGDAIGMADLTLLPQVANARRWNVAIADLARINAVVAELEAVEAIASVHPERVRPPRP